MKVLRSYSVVMAGGVTVWSEEFKTLKAARVAMQHVALEPVFTNYFGINALEIERVDDYERGRRVRCRWRGGNWSENHRKPTSKDLEHWK